MGCRRSFPARFIRVLCKSVQGNPFLKPFYQKVLAFSEHWRVWSPRLVLAFLKSSKSRGKKISKHKCCGDSGITLVLGYLCFLDRTVRLKNLQLQRGFGHGNFENNSGCRFLGRAILQVAEKQPWPQRLSGNLIFKGGCLFIETTLNHSLLRVVSWKPKPPPFSEHTEKNQSLEIAALLNKPKATGSSSLKA